MKRAICSLLIILILAGCGQENTEATMSDFKAILPEQTRQMVTHPSCELADVTSYVIVNGAARVRSLTQSLWGLYSLAVTPSGANANSGVYFGTTGVAGQPYTFSVWVYGVLGDAYQLRIEDGVPAVLGTTAFIGTGAWQRVTVTANLAANTTLRGFLTKDLAGGGVFYADGFQMENSTHVTTYIDGTRPDCEWLGLPHANISQRSGQSRAGGWVRDLETDYSLDISGVVSAGAPPQTVHVDEFAISPGGQYGSTKIHPRAWLLMGAIHGTSHADYHAKRQALIQLFDVKAHPESQPVTLRYTGAAVEKEIDVYYEGGLEGSLRAADPACHREEVVIRFVSDDPFWRGVGQDSQVLDPGDSALFRMVARWRKDTEEWDPMGPPAGPGTAVYIYVYAIAEDDEYIYIGGDFQDWANIPAADYVVRYHKQTGVYSAMGAGFDDRVNALVVGNDGTVYAAGRMHNIIGVGAAAHCAQWDPVAGVWSAMGGGVDDRARALAVGHTGLIYVGGFHHNDGTGASNHISTWDPVAAVWAPLGAGTDQEVYALVTRLNGRIVAGGAFNNAGGAPALKVAEWDPVTGTWVDLNSGMDSTVLALAESPQSVLFAGGLFTTPGLNIAQMSSPGGGWTPLGAGTNHYVYTLAWGPDDMLWVGGFFTAAGGTPLADKVARWTGTSWVHLDLDLPGDATVVEMYASQYRDPVVGTYDVFLGYNTEGAGTYAKTTIVTNTGTAPVHPTIVVKRTGGGKGSTGGRAYIRTVHNESDGKFLAFSYGLLNGETLTVDLTPTNQSVKSSWPPAQGRAASALMHSSDRGTFILRMGANTIATLIHVLHAEYNDAGNQLSGYEGITGILPTTVDAGGSLYVSIIWDGADYHVEIYDNVARGGADLIAHTAPDYAAPGTQTIVADGGSGLGGYLQVDNVVGADATIIIKPTFVDAHLVWTNAHRSYD